MSEKLNYYPQPEQSEAKGRVIAPKNENARGKVITPPNKVERKKEQEQARGEMYRLIEACKPIKTTNPVEATQYECTTVRVPKK